MPHSPEQNPIPSETIETREPKVDFDWEKHVKVEMENFGKQLKIITLLNIIGPRGSVDILKMCQPYIDEPIVIKNRNESGGYFDGEYKKERRIGLNKFDDVIDLAVLMHELGHAQQKKDKIQDKKLKINSDLAIQRQLNLITPAKLLLKIAKVYPETAQYLGEKNLAELNNLEKQYNDLKKDLNKDYLRKYDIDEELALGMSAEAERIKVKRSSIFDNLGDKLYDILNLPLKIEERDATARALKWFRKISDKTGIDFFKKFKVEKPAESDNCQNSIQEGMAEPDKFEQTSVVQYLNNCLNTYKAKTLTDAYDPDRTGRRIKPKLKNS